LQHALPGAEAKKIKINSEIKAVAIYSASVKTVSRGGGRSATAAAAYREAELISDQRTGEIHDYRRRSGVDCTHSFAPACITPQPSAELWNRAEAAEVRRNARVAREVLVALPHELNSEQRRELAKGIAQGLADRYGVAGSLAVHAPDKEGDNRNHHVHILMTTRRIEPSGELGEKTRELDDLKTGPVEIEWIRELVEVRTNRALELAGCSERVDRRSLTLQHVAAIEAGDLELADALNRPATQHEGPRVTQIRREAEKRGGKVLGSLDRAAANDAVHAMQADRVELKRVSAEIIDFESARAERAARVRIEEIAANGMAAALAKFEQRQEQEARMEATRVSMLTEVVATRVVDPPSEPVRAVRASVKASEAPKVERDIDHGMGM
jgi:hypothetical protein